MTSNWSTDFGYSWLILPLAAFIFGMAILIWKRQSILSILSIYSVITILLVVILWLKDWRASELVFLNRYEASSALTYSERLLASSGSGGLQLRFEKVCNVGIWAPDQQQPHTLRLGYSKSTAQGIMHYPNLLERPKPGQKFYLNQAGFSVTIVNETDDPNRRTVAHFYGIVVPIWFVLLLCTIFPLIWFRRFRRMRYRLRHGLCQKCAYDLRASKDKCPECGTAIPSSASPSLVQPPTNS